MERKKERKKKKKIKKKYGLTISTSITLDLTGISFASLQPLG